MAIWHPARRFCLALVEPIDNAHSRTPRGLLRGDDGAVEPVAVQVLDIGGMREWRDARRASGHRCRSSGACATS
jgi:hypothetical protein